MMNACRGWYLLSVLGILFAWSARASLHERSLQPARDLELLDVTANPCSKHFNPQRPILSGPMRLVYRGKKKGRTTYTGKFALGVESQLLLTLWIPTQDETRAQNCYLVDHFFHLSNNADCVGLAYYKIKDSGVQGATLRKKNLCVMDPTALNVLNAQLLPWALHRFDLAGPYRRIRSKVNTLLRSRLPFSLTADATLAGCHQDNHMTRYLLPGADIDNILGLRWKLSGPSLDAILQNTAGDLSTHVGLTDIAPGDDVIQWMFANNPAACDTYSQLRGFIFDSPELGGKVRVSGFSLGAFQVIVDPSAVPSFWQFPGLPNPSTRLRISGPQGFQAGLKTMYTNLNALPSGGRLLAEIETATVNVEATASYGMQCATGNNRHYPDLTDLANRDRLRAGMLGYGAAKLAADAPACTHLPDQAAQCLDAVAAALSTKLRHVPVVLERGLTREEAEMLEEEELERLLGPDRVEIAYGVDDQHVLVTANPLSQTWGLPPCGDAFKLPTQPIARMQRLTILARDWKAALLAILANTAEGKACNRAPSGWDAEGMDFIQQNALLIYLGPWLPAYAPSQATLKVNMLAKSSAGTFLHKLHSTRTSRPPLIGLGHEMIHAWYIVTGKRLFGEQTDFDEQMTAGLPPFHDYPYTENRLRVEHDQPLRTEYLQSNAMCPVCGWPNRRAAVTCGRPNCGHALPGYPAD